MPCLANRPKHAPRLSSQLQHHKRRTSSFTAKPRHFLPALSFAHRARCAALIRARPAAETFRLGLAAPSVLLPLRSFAHLALCALAFRARADADMVRPVRVTVGKVPFREVDAC